MSTKFDKLNVKVETLEEQIKMMRSIIELQNTIIIKNHYQEEKEEKIKKQTPLIKRRFI
jgi:hypothetical protein